MRDDAMDRTCETCPHKRIEYCPLYVESHTGRGMGCVSGEEDGPLAVCRVGRGELRYEEAVAKLRAVDPHLVAQCEWNERAAAIREQRARNMRLAGVH